MDSWKRWAVSRGKAVAADDTSAEEAAAADVVALAAGRRRGRRGAGAAPRVLRGLVRAARRQHSTGSGVSADGEDGSGTADADPSAAVAGADPTGSRVTRRDAQSIS